MILTVALILAGLLLAAVALRRRPTPPPPQVAPAEVVSSNDLDRDTPIEPTLASDLAADFAASLKDDEPVTLLYRGPALAVAADLAELEERPTPRPTKPRSRLACSSATSSRPKRTRSPHRARKS
jgi:hypothetical protein